MNSKHTLLSSAAAIGLVGLLGVPLAPAQAGAGTDDVKGPACADISDGAGVNTGSLVQLRLRLSAPSCAPVTYTLYVLSADGSTSLATSAQSGLGATEVRYTVDLASSAVCVYATTSIGGHIFDRAPDTGCIELTVDGGISAQAMR